MEDSHTHILSLPDDPGTAFFAVYDGHGGANIGKYASKHLHKFIVKRPEYQSDITDALKKVSIIGKVDNCTTLFALAIAQPDCLMSDRMRCFDEK